MAGINLKDKGNLVKLADSKLKLRETAEDIRGRDVVDVKGEEIGEVKDLYVDERDMKVRFLEVASGGFLGMGATTFLVPVDAITNITEDRVMIGKERTQFTSAPKYNPTLVDERFLTETYNFYGSSPYWSSNYQYPNYPRYTGQPR